MTSKEEGLKMARDRGEQLDEAVEKIGEKVQEKVAPVAETVADKVVDLSGGRPDQKKD